METIIKRGTPIYAFSHEHKPVARVQSGSTFTIETYDCFENQITSSDTEINHVDWERINPATGPIYIEEAEPGDILAVHIDKIALENRGVMTTGPDLGIMGHKIDRFTVKMIDVTEDHAVFDDHLRIPLNKMIGVIGVAPEQDAISCGTPGRHGGNMDTTLISEGATVYFPVFHPGALFGLGDMHAAMGDGEVGVSGIEIPGKVTVTVNVLKKPSIQHPMIENSDYLGIIVSEDTLDQATKTAVEEMIEWIKPYTDLSLADLTMLMSAVGQVQVSQIVDPKLTARFLIPKWVLGAYGIDPFKK